MKSSESSDLAPMEPVAAQGGEPARRLAVGGGRLEGVAPADDEAQLPAAVLVLEENRSVAETLHRLERPLGHREELVVIGIGIEPEGVGRIGARSGDSDDLGADLS